MPVATMSGRPSILRSADRWAPHYSACANARSRAEARGWPAGYAEVAREAPDLREHYRVGAVATVRAFIDPVLAGTKAALSDCAEQRWRATGLML
ncbi:MAG TPA: hypothetical protein VKU89_00240 [Solirubrobacteraceae bacterium]|nr:hypothetical protein [Solirubrobacteraceae bacterium]